MLSLQIEQIHDTRVHSSRWLSIKLPMSICRFANINITINYLRLQRTQLMFIPVTQRIIIKIIAEQASSITTSDDLVVVRPSHQHTKAYNIKCSACGVLRWNKTKKSTSNRPFIHNLNGNCTFISVPAPHHQTTRMHGWAAMLHTCIIERTLIAHLQQIDLYNLYKKHYYRIALNNKCMIRSAISFSTESTKANPFNLLSPWL